MADWCYSFSGRPDQVHNCTITNVSMTSFSVRCTEGFNGGLPQAFLLEVWKCLFSYYPVKCTIR